MTTSKAGGARRAFWANPWMWTSLLALVCAVYAWQSLLGQAPSRDRAQAPSASPVSTAPIQSQVIRSPGLDKYAYVSDVINHLASHPHPACRDGVAGRNGLQQQLVLANTMKQQGRPQEADAVLAGIETRLDPKFKMACLTLE